jgi:TPR repeat protein
MIWRSVFAALLFIGTPSAAFAQIDPDLLAAAERGDVEAQALLGLKYRYGAGVPENGTEAVKCYRLAAEQGLAEAQYNLGLMYADGEGVPKNDIEAVKWYRLAAQQGDAAAQTNLGVMCFFGEGVPKNYVRAYAWYSMAEDKGFEPVSELKSSFAKILTPQQIAEAQAYAALCFRYDYEGCD